MCELNLRNLLFGGIICIGVGTALITLNRFPPVNFDEVANAVMAEEVLASGRVLYPLMFDVTDPMFQEFTAAGQEGLRGLYSRVLGALSTVSGRGITGLRLLSFFLWGVMVLGLTMLVKRWLGVSQARWVALLGVLSFDGVLAAHLVRPDVWLGVVMVLVMWLTQLEKGSAFWRWTIVGFFSAVTIGFHPHGILWMIWSFIVWRFFSTKEGRPHSFLGLFFGTVVGLSVSMISIDITTYVMGKNSYVFQVYQSRTLDWLHRLSPVTLLRDSVLLVVKPDTFYIPPELRINWLWQASGIALFVMYGTSWVYSWAYGRAHPLIRYCLCGSLIFFFGIGYGHLRQEILYLLPVTLLWLPLIGWSMTDALTRKIKNVTFPTVIILSLCMVTVGVSSVSHQWLGYIKTEPLSKTYEQTERLIGFKPSRLLAPTYYWFLKSETFRDVNGVVLDYFYSGQKRVGSCVARYQPDVLIVDEEFRRRFQILFDPKTKNYSLVPMSDLLNVPCIYSGSLDATPQHPRLDIYRIEWDLQ